MVGSRAECLICGFGVTRVSFNFLEMIDKEGKGKTPLLKQLDSQLCLVEAFLLFRWPREVKIQTENCQW